MRLRRVLSFTMSSALVGISVALAASTLSAAPESGFVSTWQSLYPGSQTLANVQSGTGTACQTCHVSLGGGKNYNGYGKKIHDLLNSGSSLTNAILGAENLNSDADPLGTFSIDEINASTQPGWTAGANNTHYNNSGVTATDQLPPSGILGTMDLCEAVATETVRAGTPANPSAFLPGMTSRPLVGQTWDPVVDHSSFHTGAVFDIMMIDTGGPINATTPWGTLLCNIPSSAQIFTNGAGTPFAIPVPVDCAFVGLAACSQVAAFAPGNIQLTNALDIVVGTY